jgi:hypothetical protein
MIELTVGDPPGKAPWTAAAGARATGISASPVGGFSPVIIGPRFVVVFAGRMVAGG